MLHIVRTIFLGRGTAYQRIGIQNHSESPANFNLTLMFDNDFADLFEVRGEKRARRGVSSGKLLSPADVALEYSGLDNKSRTTALHFDPRPTRLAVGAATYHFDLAPQEKTSLFIAAACWRIAARCANRPGAPRASRPPTTSSMRCCASRWPTSTC
jgi:glycogen debranching enzyme